MFETVLVDTTACSINNRQNLIKQIDNCTNLLLIENIVNLGLLV